MGVAIVSSLFPGAGSLHWVILTVQRGKSVLNLKSRRMKIAKKNFKKFCLLNKSLDLYDIPSKTNQHSLTHETPAVRNVTSVPISKALGFPHHL